MHDSQPPAASPPSLFRCERVTYRTVEVDQIVDAAHCTTRTALAAIRWVRDQVRAIAAQLPPGEAVEARRWDEGGGCIGALGALHRGEACGFALRHGDTWSEWTLRPWGEADRLVRAEVGPGVRCEGLGVVLGLTDDGGPRDRR
ncbi:hypothetical protein [Streptomyces sp. NPDC060184]|uniref:hypothetical protein n=1 Tax=Streptomyces sp. NPDC060184 TaxID=3347064 RepID=UPI003651333A